METLPPEAPMATRSPLMEQVVGDDRVVDLGFKNMEETELADTSLVLWTA